MISDSKKIEILERELDEKDKQIDELTAEIEELQSVINSYDGVDKAMDELRDAIETSNKRNREYKDINHEHIRLTKEYRKDMHKFFKSVKIE